MMTARQLRRKKEKVPATTANNIIETKYQVNDSTFSAPVKFRTSLVTAAVMTLIVMCVEKTKHIVLYPTTTIGAATRRLSRTTACHSLNVFGNNKGKSTTADSTLSASFIFVRAAVISSSPSSIYVDSSTILQIILYNHNHNCHQTSQSSMFTHGRRLLVNSNSLRKNGQSIRQRSSSLTVSSSNNQILGDTTNYSKHNAGLQQASNKSTWKMIYRGGDDGSSHSSSSPSSSSRQRRWYYDDKKIKKDAEQDEQNEQDGVQDEQAKATSPFPSSSTTSTKSPSSSPMSSSSLLYSSPRRSRMFQSARTGFGNVIAAAGFVSSSVMSLLTFNRDSFKSQFTVPLEALRNYLERSGVDIELSRAVNRRLATNMALLARANMHHIRQERRQRKTTKKLTTVNERQHQMETTLMSPGLLEEAQRYMRFATAVYGQAMIRAAEVDARGAVDTKGGIATKEVIGNHISVPPEDIVLLDVNYDGDTNCLRHLLVVDHKNRKVVLSIRGTFSLSEVVVDVAGFSRPFCGGEAHSEMANYAERIWEKTGPTILDSLDKHEGYEFIVTGHSLGAGAACLLTILLDSKELLPKSQQMRCFAYASPPCFTPLEFVPQSGSKIANFIHQNDAVPFLSVDSVRHLFQDICAVDKFSHTHMTRSQRYQVILGTKDVPSDLVGAIIESEGKSLEPKKGAPVLYVPAKQNIWLQCEDASEEGIYYYEIFGSRDLVRRGIKVHPEMLLDHFPARYEHAFDHLVEKGKENK